MRAGAAMERLLDHATRRSAGLSLSQYQVLAALLASDPAPLEPREIGAAIGSGSAHVTMLLDHLERSGHLERRPHRRTVELTAQGRERATAAAAAVSATCGAVMARAGGVTADDLLAAAGAVEAAVGHPEGGVWAAGEGDPGHSPVPGGR